MVASLRSGDILTSGTVNDVAFKIGIVDVAVRQYLGKRMANGLADA